MIGCGMAIAGEWGLITLANGDEKGRLKKSPREPRWNDACSTGGREQPSKVELTEV